MSTENEKVAAQVFSLLKSDKTLTLDQRRELLEAAEQLVEILWPVLRVAFLASVIGLFSESTLADKDNGKSATPTN